MAKNKNLIIIGAVIVVLLILSGSYFIFLGKKSSTSNQAPASQSQSEQAQSSEEDQSQSPVPTITDSQLGLSLTAEDNDQKVLIQINNTNDIQSIDYQLSYTSTGNIPRGILGSFNINQGQPASQEIVLGTCSDVCHYDTGVTSVQLTLKVVKTDNNTYQLVKTLNF